MSDYIHIQNTVHILLKRSTTGSGCEPQPRCDRLDGGLFQDLDVAADNGRPLDRFRRPESFSF